VLPRVSAALSKFISPIVSSNRDQKRDSRQSFKKQDPKAIERPPLKVVPQAFAAPKISAPTLEPLKMGVAETFIELFKMLRGHSAHLSRRMGQDAYANPKGLKRSRKRRERKGVLLDKKVE